jgi:hypothetical protein
MITKRITQLHAVPRHTRESAKESGDDRAKACAPRGDLAAAERDESDSLKNKPAHAKDGAPDDQLLARTPADDTPPASQWRLLERRRDRLVAVTSP